MQKKVGQEGEVHSFDAFAKHIDFLQETLKRNQINNVHAKNMAIAEKTGAMELHIPDDTGKVSIKNRNNKSQTQSVRCMSLQEFLKKQNIKQVDFMKVDVEGAELDVVVGLGDDLDRVSNLVMGVHSEIIDNASLFQLYTQTRLIIP
ncbi:MAG: FkbM family methyltransferase [Halobacteriaceae archaeon]